jgi:UDP-N-acetylglucosamine:LPS N-acetylglucosamine transferase
MSNAGAAVLLKDSEAVGKLKTVIDQVMADSEKAKSLGENIKGNGQTQSGRRNSRSFGKYSSV